MKTKNKLTKTGRKSLKGKYGHVGAPPKPIKFPSTPFTFAALFKMNSKGANKQCQLSIRNKVDERIAQKSIIQLQSRKQKGGKVGRPKDVFILAEKFNAKKHVKFGAVEQVKTRSKAARVTAVTETVTPTVSPVLTTSTPVEAVAAIPSAPVTSVPVETAPAIVEAPVSQPEVAAPTVPMPAVTEPVVA